jgi:hypothetical protein
MVKEIHHIPQIPDSLLLHAMHPSLNSNQIAI